MLVKAMTDVMWKFANWMTLTPNSSQNRIDLHAVCIIAPVHKLLFWAQTPVQGINSVHQKLLNWAHSMSLIPGVWPGVPHAVGRSLLITREDLYIEHVSRLTGVYTPMAVVTDNLPYQENHSCHPMSPTDHCRVVSIFHRNVRWRSKHVWLAPVAWRRVYL